MKKVAIVGGGITGLSCAYYLHTAAKGDVEITLIESAATLGGKVKTDTETPGRVVEAGPDSIITTKPAGLQLMKELGLEEEIINPKTTKSFILNRGGLRSIPPDFMSLVPKNMIGFLKSDLFSLHGKLRLLCEKWIKPARQGEDESLAEFVTRRCGVEICDRFAEPLFAGIYAAKADEISVKASFPHWKGMEEKHGSITAAVFKAPKPPASIPGARKYNAFVSLRGGMQVLVDAIAKRLSGVKIRLNTEIRGLGKTESGSYVLTGADGTMVHADTVVLATPAYVAARLLERLAPKVSVQLNEIPYASTMIVSLVYASRDMSGLPNATGFVVSAKEKYSFTGCSWSSNKWENRTGKDEFLVRCFYGKAGNEQIADKSDAVIQELAIQEMNEVLSLKGALPKNVYIHRYPKAMPQYTVGHLDKLAVLDRELGEVPGVHLVGAGYRGIGIPDCVKQGKELAERILQE